MYTCIYSLRQFEKADREHILQNFLRVRWDSDCIVSNDMQRKFSRTIDLALSDGLKEIRALLGTQGGRGGAGRSLKVQSTSGKTMLLHPGGSATLAEPTVSPIDGDISRLAISLSSIDQVGWVIKKITDLNPGVNESQVRTQLEAYLSKDPPMAD